MFLLLFLVSTSLVAQERPPLSGVEEEVAGVERSFAASMAARDLQAFARLIAEDAVFLNNGNPLRGREAILAHWQAYFSEPTAPFSWQPEHVIALPTGDLAQTEGPVNLPGGQEFARFISVWRKTGTGWQIVFDHGHLICPQTPGEK